MIEGLDAAIEAAARMVNPGFDALTPADQRARLSAAGAYIRAASPLIERAALHAAASEAHLCDDCQINIRARATRPETS